MIQKDDDDRDALSYAVANREREVIDFLRSIEKNVFEELLKQYLPSYKSQKISD